jgi:thiamine kinase-like enzyme
MEVSKFARVFFVYFWLGFLTPIESMTTTMTKTTSAAPSWLGRVQELFPTMTSYEVIETISQPNGLGYKVKLQYSADTENEVKVLVPDQIFVKTVNASNYQASKKDWPDLRRTLLYARTEARFYHGMLPILKQRGFNAAPHVYLAWHDLSGWIPDDEIAVAPADPTVDKNSLLDANSKGCLLVMECISDATHFQASPLTLDQAKECLAAAAHLHAAAFQDVELLQRASVQLSRASFHLEMRNPKELIGMEDSWDHFVTHFRDAMVERGVWSDSVQALGQRVSVLAKYISTELSPQPSDPYATMIHGDYKSMNVLLANAGSGASAVLVDYASIGIGLGMSDVAMHLHHAVLPEDLANGGEEELVQYYWKTLQESLPENNYPWEMAQRHYRLAVVDYFRFFLGRMWKTATLKTMQEKKDNKNINLINRSVPAACEFVGRVDQYLTEIEKEYRALQQEL